MGIFDRSIALAPTGGAGVSIGASALRPADIIVSTTDAAVSGAIRVGTASPVSHAALFAGNGNVIEAIGEGVTRRALSAALTDDVLAVAYRHPAMTDDTARKILKYAEAQLGKPYSASGALMAKDVILCRVAGGRSAAFFCSQLVIASYKQGGLPLTSLPPQCVTPANVVEIAEHKLKYVGHLMGNASYFPVISP